MKTIAFGDVKALAAVFSFRGDRTLIVEAEPAETIAFWDQYGHDAKRADHYGLDDWGNGFFAFWVENCFDPSIAIVRADSFETAYEIFCDEFADWIKIDDSDLADYDPETLNYNGSGVAIDTESVQGSEISLLRIIVSHSAA